MVNGPVVGVPHGAGRTLKGGERAAVPHANGVVDGMRQGRPQDVGTIALVAGTYDSISQLSGVAATEQSEKKPMSYLLLLFTMPP